MTREPEAAAVELHAPDCAIWDLPPDAAPEALLAEGLEDETLIRYAGAVRPLYDALKRVLGQLGGFLILAQTGARPERDAPILVTAAAQLAEATERLRAVAAPGGTQRHLAVLVAAAGQLDRVLQLLRRPVELADSEQAETMSLLFAAHRTLLGAAIPEAGMTPVDFSSACCNCGIAKPAPKAGKRKTIKLAR